MNTYEPHHLLPEIPTELPESLTGGQIAEVQAGFAYRFRLKQQASFANWLNSPRKELMADKWLYTLGQVRHHLPAELVDGLFQAHPWLLEEAAERLKKRE